MQSIPITLCDDGVPPTIWVAKISYEFRDNHHIFTSDEIEGFYVVSKDGENALNQILPSIEALIKHNYDKNCCAEFGLEFKVFAKKHIISSVKEPMPAFKDTFVVIREAA
jgi:hypothetical protein